MIPSGASKRLFCFFGSTIGNFNRELSKLFLEEVAAVMHPGDRLLLGVDRVKDIAVLESAYNDAQGITAQFNLNLLQHINRELDGNFCLDKFRHRACYDQAEHRIEISLVSCCQQQVRLGEHTFLFAEGEPIITEYSHKYIIEEFAALAAEVGLTLRRTWKDEQQMFAVLHLALLKST